MTDFATMDALIDSMTDGKRRDELKRYLRLLHACQLLGVERLEAVRIRPNDVVVLYQVEGSEPAMNSSLGALKLCFPQNACLVLRPGDKLETYSADRRSQAPSGWAVRPEEPL